MLLLCLAAGCANLDGGDAASPAISIAASPEAFADASAADATKAADQSSAEATDLTLVKVPLDGAVRRLVTDTLEAAAISSADTAAPRAAVVLPATSSGEQPPVVGVARIAAIAATQVNKDFPGLRTIGDDPRLLSQADWAVLLNVHFAPDVPVQASAARDDGAARLSHLCVRILDLNSGRTLAAKRQLLDVASINRVLTRYFRDLPVVLPWPQVIDSGAPCSGAVSAENSPGRGIDWRARLGVEMHFGRAASYYALHDHGQSREAFRALARAVDAAAMASSLGSADAASARLHARMGEYLTTWRMVFNRGAEGLLRPLVEALFDDQGEVSLNLALSPINADIIAGRRMKSRQTEWLIEISRLLKRKRWCADIIGFATDDFRTGGAYRAGGEPLALQHADYVLGQLRRHSAFRSTALVSHAAGTPGAIAVNLTGDVRDEWARRVMVRVVDCRRDGRE